MNIDITALLSGGAPTRAGKGKLIGEDFALTLDDRLAQMGLLLRAGRSGAAVES